MAGGRKKAGYCGVVTAAVITWLSERGDEMSILTIMIIAIIVNFVVGLIVGLISKDERVAIVAVIVADFILIVLYALQ